jgi:hypothetical protein
VNVVKESVASVPAEHEVRMMDFTNWLERKGNSPREDRQRIPTILGIKDNLEPNGLKPVFDQKKLCLWPESHKRPQ